MSETELQAAFDDLVEAAERSAAAVEEALGEAVARHPHLAGDLGDFAAELLLQDALTASDAAGDDEAVVSSALRRFQNRLDEVGEECAPIPNPFDERPAAELLRVGVALGLDKTLLVKLRDRKIEAETVPLAFVERLAGELGVAFPLVAAHLQAPPIVHRGMSFKAKEKPRPGLKEDFAEAVRRSTLDDEEKARWLDEPGE